MRMIKRSSLLQAGIDEATLMFHLWFCCTVFHTYLINSCILELRKFDKHQDLEKLSTQYILADTYLLFHF